MLSHGLALSQPAAPPATPAEPAVQPAAPATNPPPLAAEPQPAPAESAGREECAWSGKRVVTLLWRDDINGAREQLRFYDRFLCPDTQLRDAFRCVIKSGEFDADKPESVAAKVGQCWTAPGKLPQEPPASAKPAAQ
jgi:hypothetical protein